MRQKQPERGGFTLVEVMVAVAIICVLGAVALLNLQGDESSTNLSSATNEIAAVLREAQSNAMSQEQNVSWGVHFSNATNTAPFFAIFTGSSYASGTTQAYYRLPASVGYVSATLQAGSSTDIIFSEISGMTPTAEGICLSVNNSTINTSAIVVGAAGVVSDAIGSCYATWESGTYLSQYSIIGGGGFPNGIGGMAIDASGDFFLVDIGNKDVVEFSSNGSIIRTIGSYGTGNGQFGAMAGDAVSASGNLWVADPGNFRIEEFSATGTYEYATGSQGHGNDQFEDVGAIAIDGSGNLWVTDATRVEEFSSSGSYLSQFTINGGGRFTGGVGGMAIDSNGNFFIADIYNKDVAEFNNSGSFVRTIGSYGTGNGQFGAMAGVAVDASGNIWAADPDNFRVEEFSNTGTFEYVFGSQGHGNGQFESVGSLEFDKNGDLWVTDGNRVEEFTGEYLGPNP